MNTMPDASIIPVLGYQRVPQAIEWLVTHFGFRERWRVGEHRAQMSYGNGTIVVYEHKQPTTANLLVRVDDVNAHYEHISRLLSVNPPVDFPYGERQYGVQDLAGHIWTFSQTIRTLSPEAWGGTSAPISH